MAPTWNNEHIQIRPKYRTPRTENIVFYLILAAVLFSGNPLQKFFHTFLRWYRSLQEKGKGKKYNLIKSNLIIRIAEDQISSALKKNNQHFTICQPNLSHRIFEKMKNFEYLVLHLMQHLKLMWHW